MTGNSSRTTKNQTSRNARSTSDGGLRQGHSSKNSSLYGSDYGGSRDFGRRERHEDNHNRNQNSKASFAGKGPKGYRRTDERILEDASEMLTRHPEIDASGVELKVKDGVLILTGTVDSRQAKRLTENICHECSGIVDIHNQIRIEHTSREGRRYNPNDSKKPDGKRS